MKIKHHWCTGWEGTTISVLKIIIKARTRDTIIKINKYNIFQDESNDVDFCKNTTNQPSIIQTVSCDDRGI
jgi:hypothetical protein